MFEPIHCESCIYFNIRAKHFPKCSKCMVLGWFPSLQTSSRFTSFHNGKLKKESWHQMPSQSLFNQTIPDLNDNSANFRLYFIQAKFFNAQNNPMWGALIAEWLGRKKSIKKNPNKLPNVHYPFSCIIVCLLCSIFWLQITPLLNVTCRESLNCPTLSFFQISHCIQLHNHTM